MGWGSDDAVEATDTCTVAHRGRWLVEACSLLQTKTAYLRADLEYVRTSAPRLFQSSEGGQLGQDSRS